MALPTLLSISNDAMAVGAGATCSANTPCDSGLTCGSSNTCVGIADVVGNNTTVNGTNYANKNTFVQTICNVLRIVTGNGGKAFAAFAIISLGIGFFTGKVSWGLMIGVACGIAAMFGAPTIVSAISGSDSYRCIDQ